jgi:hypothetical protein
MPDTPDEFGGWLTAPDGTAHYILAGQCLCKAKVKKFGGPPERKPGPVPGAVGKIVTPLCFECMNRNYIRWARKGGKSEHVLSQSLDRRHRRNGK